MDGASTVVEDALFNALAADVENEGKKGTHLFNRTNVGVRIARLAYRVPPDRVRFSVIRS
jgi:hypothetical protein